MLDLFGYREYKRKVNKLERMVEELQNEVTIVYSETKLFSYNNTTGVKDVVYAILDLLKKDITKVSTKEYIKFVDRKKN